MRRPAFTGRAFRLSSAATMLAGLPLKLSSITVTPSAVCSTPRPVMMPTWSSSFASAAASSPAAWIDASAASAFCRRCGAPGVRLNSICLPFDLRGDVPALALAPHASAPAPRTPSPKRTTLPFHSGASTSAGSTSTPSLGRPCAMLTFSRRIASRLPSFSRCTGCTFTTSATVGRVSSLSRAISPVWFMPISTTHTLASGWHCTASAARPRNC